VSAKRTTLEEKVASLIRLFASERDGEVIAAARAIVRVMESTGKDIHALADRVGKMNGGGLSEVEMKKIYDTGYQNGYGDGARAVEQRAQPGHLLQYRWNASVE
jgi:hypothetical protein